MKIIYNKFIPFKGFAAINILGIIFAREGAKITERTIRHERIHSQQQKEMLWIFFYLCYLIEWLIRVLFTRDRFSHKAYSHISFEREAYAHENDESYLSRRKHYAWITKN